MINPKAYSKSLDLALSVLLPKLESIFKDELNPFFYQKNSANSDVLKAMFKNELDAPLLFYQFEATKMSVDLALKGLSDEIKIKSTDEPFTFKLVLNTSDKPINPNIINQALKITNETKNVRSVCAGVKARFSSEGTFNLKILTHTKVSYKILPLNLSRISADIRLKSAITYHNKTKISTNGELNF